MKIKNGKIYPFYIFLVKLHQKESLGLTFFLLNMGGAY